MLSGIADFLSITGFGRMLEDPSLLQNGVMLAIGLGLIGLGIARRWEPLLLIPIGFGMLMGNIPAWWAQGILPVGFALICYRYTLFVIKDIWGFFKPGAMP